MKPLALYTLALSAVLVAPVLGAQHPEQGTGEVRLIDIAPSKGYPDAVEPGCLKLACADSLESLRKHFESRKLPFVETLVRRADSGFCHVDYEPTIRGFRSDPDNLPAIELFGDANSLSFLSRREVRLGDALDIIRTVFRRADAPIRLTLGISGGHAESWYRQALQFHFGPLADRVTIRDNGGEAANPWVQDYLKSGTIGAQTRLLVSRQLYEGVGEDESAFQPFLKTFREERFVRSNLSWEGGDLQFVQSPKNPDRLILLYGDRAKRFWEQGLTAAESEYVLKLEFGADDLFEMADPVSHVDYMVTMIPSAGVALVAEPVAESQELARAAVSLLYQIFGNGPEMEVLKIARELGMDAARFHEGRRSIREALLRAKPKAKDWTVPVDVTLMTRLQEYVALNCSQSPEDCFSFQGSKAILETDLELLRSWVSASLAERDRARLAPCLLAVVESQLPGYRYRDGGKYERTARTLRALGFRVVRVPRIAGDPGLHIPWAGISYANSLVLGRKLFVPVFGLGLPEDNYIEKLQTDLPDCEVVPVYARHMILNNGGVHCAMAALRSVATQ